MADDEYDQFNGRKPSFNFTKGGPVLRGFRSRPGAPMHDPTKNNPMSRDNSTPRSNWDAMFRSRASGVAPKEVEDELNPAIEELDAFNQELKNRFNPASLETMASGGMNHAQRWSAPPPRPADRSWSPAPFMPRGPKDKFYVDNQGGFFETPVSQDGWKTTSLREANAIADKYKPKSSFGWGSAFRA